LLSLPVSKFRRRREGRRRENIEGEHCRNKKSKIVEGQIWEKRDGGAR